MVASINCAKIPFLSDLMKQMTLKNPFHKEFRFIHLSHLFGFVVICDSSIVLSFYVYSNPGIYIKHSLK